MNKYKVALKDIMCCVPYGKLKEQEELLEELVEKATPKKVIVNGIREGRQINTVSFICPSCENHIGKDNFCKYCGQALDWKAEEPSNG